MADIYFHILFKNNRAYISPTKSFSLVDVDVSDVKNFENQARWKMKFSKYFPYEKRISASVISYNTGEGQFIDLPSEFAVILESLEKISIPKLNTLGKLTTLKPSPKKEFKTQTASIYKSSSFVETLVIPLEETTFGYGHISFDYRSSRTNGTIKIKVCNDFIKPELEDLKPYFVQALKMPKARVEINLILTGNRLDSVNAVSQDLMQINESILPSIRLPYIQDQLRIKQGTDKVLQTVNDLLENESGGYNYGEILSISTADLLEHLVVNSKTKHSKHIQYLSSKHLSDLLPIQMGPRLNSLLFFVHGSNNDYFIWETFDTKEATYAWSKKSEQTIDLALEEVSATIKEIEEYGKNEYMRSNKREFNRLIHTYSEIGFQNWKRQLEMILG